MPSKPGVSSVAQYLASLPPGERKVISKVRQVVRKHLPAGYEESFNWGMICYEIPLSHYPKTYNGEPLCYAGLAAQKTHYALYLMGPYGDPAQARKLQDGFKKAGKKLDMGASCLRFQSLDDLPLEVVGKVIAGVPAKKFIAMHEAAHKKEV
jgi:hypothetical protein